MKVNDTPLPEQTRATRALAKFCRDHGYASHWMDNVGKCLRHLEAGDLAKAHAEFLQVPLGGNGCFNDWWPPVAFTHEDEEFVWAEFEALCERWSRLMKLPEKD